MENNIKPKVAWWKPAVILSIQVSTWILVPAIVGPLIGKALDEHFNSYPWFLIISIILSFITSIFFIRKLTKGYLKKLEKEAKNQNDGNKQ